jgi:peptidoglycan/LPS O-acetylase OafA/YrhL
MTPRDEAIRQAPAVSRAASGPIPSLDGIRALSVALVFFSHIGFGNLIPGDLGVTAFFVLSGFLITTLMREEYAKRGGISFPAFYLRRLLRLVPPLLVVTCLAAALSFAARLGEPFTRSGLLSVLLYFSNYFRIFHGNHGQPPGLEVTWSLAVEEHYYLLYPPLALLLLRLRRPALSSFLLSLLCLAILLWRCWLILAGASTDYLSMATDTRVDSILFGCLLAMARNPWLDPVPRLDRGRVLGVAAVCIGVLIGTLLWRNEFFRFTLRYTIQSMAIAVLLYLAVARADLAPFRWLNARPLVYIGAVSYTIYLVHYIFWMWCGEHLAGLGRFAVILGAAASTVAFAALMRHFVEKPCADLRRRLHRSLSLRGRRVEAAASGGV